MTRAFLACLAVGLAMAAIALTPARAQTPEQRYLDWATPLHEASVFEGRRHALLTDIDEGLLLIPSHHGVSDGHSFRQLDDFWHLTGLELPSSMLVLDGRSRRAMLFVPSRDARFESASRPNDFPGRPLLEDRALWRRSGFTDVRVIDDLEAFLDAAVTGGRRLMVNPGRSNETGRPSSGPFLDWSPVDGLLNHLYSEWPSAQVSSAFEAMARLRMIKGPEEIEVIRRVVSLTAEAIQHASGFVREGVTERDLEAELEATYKRGGAQRLAFASIVKSGPNSLWPWRVLAAHYDRRNRTMANGELVIFDVGTELNGYVSDVGRTFPVSGMFSQRQREILEMEVAVADAIIAAIRPGVLLSELMDIAKAAIPDEHEQYMQTGSFFGHYIGRSTGDPALYDVPMEAGMVITVEPWYYNHDEGISVFTEDVVLVTAAGAEVLSAALPRTPSELEEMVGKHQN